MREAAKKRMEDAQSPPTQEPRLRSISIVFELRILSEGVCVNGPGLAPGSQEGGYCAE